MTVLPQLVQELMALAICGGAHKLVLQIGEERWELPVIDGRVGTILGAFGGDENPDALAQELLMICGLEGVELRRQRFPEGRAEMRWGSAAQLARSLDRGAVSGIGEALQSSLRPPDLASEMDVLDAVSGTILHSGDLQAALDAAVGGITELHRGALMLHADGAGGWIGPSGALVGTTDRLDAAARQGGVELFAAAGEAYEADLGRPPVVVLLGLTEAVVVALPWMDDRVRARPGGAIIIARLFRVAQRAYVSGAS
jgi:hypothetical protein